MCLRDHFEEETDNYSARTNCTIYNHIFSKTAQEENQRTTKAKWLTLNTQKPDRSQKPDHCPVRLWRKMILKRTKNINTRRLFLAVNKNWQKYPDSCWDKNMPLRVNKISK